MPKNVKPQGSAAWSGRRPKLIKNRQFKKTQFSPSSKRTGGLTRTKKSIPLHNPVDKFFYLSVVYIDEPCSSTLERLSQKAAILLDASNAVFCNNSQKNLSKGVVFLPTLIHFLSSSLYLLLYHFIHKCYQTSRSSANPKKHRCIQSCERGTHTHSP